MSKSVMESASAASTGRKKNTPMTASAGATNHHAARLRLTGHPGGRVSSGASRGFVRRGLHALELLAERAGVHIVGDTPLGPGCASRGKVACQPVEPTLDVGPRK